MTNRQKAIKYLLNYNHLLNVPSLAEEDKFRVLMNITLPIDLSNDFYQCQDEVLQAQMENKTITDVSSLLEIKPCICLVLQDITSLKADIIVNACNEKLLGCFQPLHHCIDNAIHSGAGLQVRRDLMVIMNQQGHDEENGKCKVTSGYNLPSKYIFHTVGPKVSYKVIKKDQDDLRNCYLSCLEKANEMGMTSIVFPSISTGVYGFPIKEASTVAISTVKEYFSKHQSVSIRKVIFDVFSQGDYLVYEKTINELY